MARLLLGYLYQPKGATMHKNTMDEIKPVQELVMSGKLSRAETIRISNWMEKLVWYTSCITSQRERMRNNVPDDRQ